MWVIGEELGEYRAYIEQLRTVTKRSGIQARVPYSLEIK